MKSFNRSDRISQQIKRELSEMIQQGEIKDDRISGMVSITQVIVSHDLRMVKVYFSVFGDESQRVGTLAALEDASGYLRGELCRRLKMRFAPDMNFYLDDSLEKGQKVVELLDKIKNQQQ